MGIRRRRHGIVPIAVLLHHAVVQAAADVACLTITGAELTDLDKSMWGTRRWWPGGPIL
jgi:hypothetical protein